ncbi:MAG: putative Ig domain-containing protein, partial [Chitinophagaceae bacterium]
TFFETTGTESLLVRISGAGLPKQAIPDSYLGLLHANATTLAPQTAPAYPASLTTSGRSKTSLLVTWTDKSKNETGFELFRSATTASNFLLFAQLPPNTTTYVDTPLYGNAVYYYKVRAVNAGGISVFSNSDSGKTFNTAPSINTIQNRTARYGITASFTLKATDPDGDQMSFAGSSLPSFATLSNNANGTATMTFSPLAAHQGVYPGLTVIVTDTYGEKDTTQFSLTVNDNYDPVITGLTNYTIDENAIISIPLSAADQNSAGTLAWSVTGLPSNYTLTPGTNGSATLVLQPTYASAGIYPVTIDVADGSGGFGATSFTLTVNDINPTKKIYVRMMAAEAVGEPWNNVSGASSSNFKDATGTATGIGLNFQPASWNVATNGPQTGNNSGIYPDAVLRSHYYFGTWWTPATVSANLTGLNPAGRYNFTFHAGSIWDIAPDNGSVTYSIGSKSVSLYVQNNTRNTVTLTNIQPAADGSVSINMSKGSGATAGYLNSIVITSLFSDATLPAAAITLEGQSAPEGVRLSWTDLAYNESEFEIYRSLTATGPFALIGTAAADETTYTDEAYTGKTTYYYKVRASNSVGASAYTNIVSVKTLNRIPKIAPINDVKLKNNQSLLVTVSATDDAGDLIRLTASNLPSFVRFTDNGNGTGVINIQPIAGSIGTYNNIIITAKDNADSSSSEGFTLTVSDKLVSLVYFNFSDGGSFAAKPWNNLSGYPAAGSTFSNIQDENDAATSINVTFPDGFLGANTMGMRARNGQEIYPEDVMRTAIVDTSVAGKRIVVAGLSLTKKYNFVFFNSREDGFNCTSRFTINGTSVTLNAGYNLNKTVQINGIVPNASGQVVITMARVSGADYALLSSMIIQSYDPATVSLLGPAELRIATLKINTLSLQWQDRADNETGYEVWRAAATGSYSLVATLAANTTTYKDTPLTANTAYHYIVRAKRNTELSDYSNVRSAKTYANTVHINFSNDYDAPAPWNNTNTVPQQGYVWNNLRDNTGTSSSVGLEETGLFAGLYGGGMTTGNNSGIFPDNVMIESYGLFPGQSATLKLTGLDVSKKYDFTFFASSQAWGDVNVAYTVNNKTSLLNASLNKTGAVTMYDIVSDEFGNVDISIAPGTQYSQFGLIGALIVQGYTPTSGAVPPVPGAPIQTATVYQRAEEIVELQPRISAHPNPFSEGFTLSMTSKSTDRMQIMLFDAAGKLVYQKTTQIIAGVNTIMVTPPKTLVPGLYFLKTSIKAGKAQQIELIRK